MFRIAMVCKNGNLKIGQFDMDLEEAKQKLASFKKYRRNKFIIVDSIGTPVVL